MQCVSQDQHSKSTVEQKVESGQVDLEKKARSADVARRRLGQKDQTFESVLEGGGCLV